MDDTLNTTRSYVPKAKAIKGILACYDKATRKNINYDKSKI